MRPRPRGESRPRHSPVDVAVNLLWCVPGDVGGSEEYLVRQLIGLADQPACFVPTLYCLPAFVDAHPELATLYPMVTAGITGSERRVGCSPRTRGWLAALVRPTSCTTAAARSRPSAGPDRADDPRPAVPHASRVPHRDEAALPRSRRSRDRSGGRASSRCRPSTCVRSSSIGSARTRDVSSSCRTASEPALGAGAPERVRPATRLRPRVRPGARVPGDHPPAQGPSLPARGDGPALD